jgi:hypothetical protein
MREPSSDDLHLMLSWNERLPLLAQAQFRYMEQLRELGFDSEQAFTLVRDWSQHSWAWSVQPPRRVEGEADPTAAGPGEPYLLGEGGDGDGAEAPPLTGDASAEGSEGTGSVWSDAAASSDSPWPGEDEIARARRQRRRRWGFRPDSGSGHDRMDDAA